MNIKNTADSFGLINKFLHWSMALIIIGLFIVGTIMTDLDYYDPLYKTLPWWHKSVGLFVMGLLVFRILWKMTNVIPKALTTHKKWEVSLAHIIQKAFYALIIVIGLSGYFISTGDGKSVGFFNFFEVSAIVETLNEDQIDLLGEVHELLAFLLIILSMLHAFAALKHHVIDKDETLKRMINK